MANISDEQLSKYVDQLLELVNKLPLKQAGKDYLQSQIIVDVYDVWQFDDEKNAFTLEEFLSDYANPKYNDVKATYGIENIKQWRRYASAFVQRIKNVRSLVLEKYLQNLEKLDPSEKSFRISKQLEQFSKADLFHKHGIKEIKDPQWNEQVKEILSDKMTFAKEQSFYLTKTEIPVREGDLNNTNFYIVEELEDWMAWEGVRYVKSTENFGDKFDPSYFATFITKDLSKRMEEFVLDKIRPLNQFEINKYLSFSLKQFDTFTPPKRHHAFLLKFHDAYWYPNPMPYKENETWQKKYSNHFWKHYTKKFEFLKGLFISLSNSFLVNTEAFRFNGGINIANVQLQKFIGLVENENPTLDPPIKSYYEWKNGLQDFKYEILDNLSLLQKENKIHYLEKIILSLHKFSSKNYVQKIEYLSLLTEYNLNSSTVINSDDFDNQFINAISSQTLIYDDSMPPGYFEQINDYQTTFYNYNLGRTVAEAVSFVQERIESLLNNLDVNKEKSKITSENPELEYIKELYGETFMPDLKNISTDVLYRALATLPIKRHKNKIPASNYFEWQNLKRELEWEVSSNLLKLPNDFDKKIYLKKLISEFTDWTFYQDYSMEVIESWELEYGHNFVIAIRSDDRQNEFVKQMRNPFSDFEIAGLQWTELQEIKDIRSNVNNCLFTGFIKHCLDFLKKYRIDLEKRYQTNLPASLPDRILSFDNVVSENKQKYILQLLEDLSITKDGKSIISERKKSSLRGIAEALIESSIFPALSLEKSYRLIAEKINVEIKSKIDSSYTSENFKLKTLKYIKDYPFR